MNTAVLALDQGSHSTRACLYDAAGRQIASAQQAVATQYPQADRVEHDAGELLTSLQRVIADCLAAAPAANVVAAGLATQRSSFVCLERATLRPLSPVISWQDRRHAAWLKQFAPREARVRAITGLPLSAHYGASKMRWCLDHLPAVRAAADDGALCLAPLASYLVSALTGAALMIDPANASRTLLWDSTRLDWSDELLTLFGIERAWLPRSADTHDDFGSLHNGNDGRRISLTAVTGDQSAVPYAFGTVDERRVYLNLGTGAFVQRALSQRPDDPTPLLGSVLRSAAAHATWSLEGTVNGAASAVSWFAATESCEVAPLWAALETLDANAELPIFLNGIGGLGSPWWQPEFASRFVDPHSAGAGTRLRRFAAVVESTLFMVAVNLGYLRKLGSPVEHLVVTGGMSRSDWLCQRLADLTGLEIQRGEAEATARGVAMLATAGLSLEADVPWRSFRPGPAGPLLGSRYRASTESMPEPTGYSAAALPK
jgi:glycerol kinase